MADTHFKRNGFEDAITSLEFIIDYVVKHDINLSIHAGDLWDHNMSINNKTAFNKVIELFKKLSNITPLFIIKGNHDLSGSLEIFNNINNRRVLAIETPFELVELHEDGFYLFGDPKKPNTQPKSVLFAIPFPEKNHFINKEEFKTDNLDDIVDKKIKDLLLNANAKVSDYDCPKIVVFHGSIQNYKKTDGKINSVFDYQITADTLNITNPDYVACGHIHNYQTFAPHFPKTCYSGSTWPVTFAEIDDKYICHVKISKDKNIYIHEKIELPIVKKLNYVFSIHNEDDYRNQYEEYKKIITNKKDDIKITIGYYKEFERRVKTFKGTDNVIIMFRLIQEDKNEEFIEELSELKTLEEEIIFYYETYNKKEMDSELKQIIFDAIEKVNNNIDAV